MLRRVSWSQGRPFGRYHKLADYKSLSYLTLIAMKYGIDLNDLFDSFVQAWGHQASTCENLMIECRKKTRDNAIFLITKGSKVVAQFPISKQVLEETNPLKEFVPTNMPRRKIQDRSETENPRIKDLKSGMKRVDLEARILEIQKPKSVFTRFGNSATVTNAKVTDETGTIYLSLWNDQIDTVSVGDIIQVENGHVVTFRGERQLRVGKRGHVSVVKKKFDLYLQEVS
jgi:replication factor A1